MLNRELHVWLAGYRAIRSPDVISKQQAQIIRNHLNLVKAVEGKLIESNQQIFDLLTNFQKNNEANIGAADVFAHLPDVLPLQSQAELAYWVQGALEIGGKDVFTVDQCRAIAKVAERTDNPGPFSNRLTDLLAYMTLYPQKASIFFNDIVGLLHSMFVHDIDPSYEGDQEHFSKVHDGLIT